MKRTENLKVVETIIIVFEKLKDSHFEDEVLGALNHELEMLANYLHCSQVQAALFTIVFGLQYKTSSEVNFSMVVEYLDENGLYLLKYIHDINILAKKELLVDKKNQGKSFYEVEKYVFNSIVENESLEENRFGRSSQEIISEIYNLIMQFKNREIIITEYTKRLAALEKKYSENEIVRNIVSAYPDAFPERVLLYSLCYRVINERDYQDEDSETEGTGFSYKIVPNSYSIDFKKQIKDKTHDLFTKGLITSRYEISGAGPRFRKRPVKLLCLIKEGINTFFGNESEGYEAEIIKCSEQSRLKEFFIEFDEKFGVKGNSIATLFSSSQDVIEPESIKEKTLYYSDEILNQLAMLSDALKNENLVAMQKRLEAKALPKWRLTEKKILVNLSRKRTK